MKKKKEQSHTGALIPLIVNENYQLFVGSARTTAKENVGWLSENHITHIISVGAKCKLDNRSFKHLAFTWTECKDKSETQISKIFQPVHQFIDEARDEARKGKIVGLLVHCQGGVSRSPAVVCSYLMKENKWSVDHCLAEMRKVRSVKPNPGFLQQLYEYQTELQSVVLLNPDDKKADFED